MLNLIQQSTRSCLCCGSNLFKVLFHRLIERHNIGTGESFNSSDARSYTALGENLKPSDLPGMLNMCTAAKLLGEITHGNHTYRISVLFSKQCHCTALLRILDTHNVCNDLNILGDFFIYNFLYPCNLFPGHGLRMAEIKTCSVSILIGALLFNMVSQNNPECFLQQMCRRMVSAGIHTVYGIHFQVCGFLNRNCTGNYRTHMSDSSSGYLYGLLNLKGTFLCTDDSGISFLSAHGSIERCFICNQGSCFPCFQGRNRFCLRCCSDNLCLRRKGIISHKLAGQIFIHGIKHTGSRCVQFCREILILPCLLLLFLHGSFKSCLIHQKPFLLCQFHCQFNRETKGIIEIKCRLTVYFLLILRSLLFQNLIELLHSVFQSALKTGNFLLQFRQNVLSVFLQERIALRINLINIHSADMQQLFRSQIQSASVSYGAANQAPEHISRTCIGRQKLCLISYQHHACADMVSQYTHRFGQLLVLFIFYAGSFLNIGNNGCKQVCLIYILCSV